MKIKYIDEKIEQICTNKKIAVKKYNMEMAVAIFKRIKQLSSAKSIGEVISSKLGRCHPLKGNRKGQYAIDLVHPARLVFSIEDREIKICLIIEITDYHKNKGN